MPRGVLNPTDKHVGSRMRMQRLMLDMSQADLGDALGLTFQQVQKYEKGRNRIGAGRLQHISQILQVQVPFFFEGGDPLLQLSGLYRAPLLLEDAGDSERLLWCDDAVAHRVDDRANGYRQIGGRVDGW